MSGMDGRHAVATTRPAALALELRRSPFPARLTLYVLAVAIVGSAGWAAWARIDRVVAAPGRLVTTQPMVVVQPLETSIIRTLDVSAGDIVRAGTVVATLDPTFAEADAATLRVRLASLEAQIARLEAAASDTPPAFPAGPEARVQIEILERQRDERRARLEAFSQRASRTAAALATNRAGQQDLAGRLAVFAEIEMMRRDLYDRQTGSRLQLLEATSQALALRGQINDLRHREGELLHEQAEIEAERTAFVGEWHRRIAEELVESRRERADIAERLAKAERRSSLVALTAPVDAVVLELARLSVGSIVRDAEPLVTLVPLGVPLEVEADIPARDIGLVAPGDRVRVKLEAFPFQRHGTLEGEVRTISADAFQGRGALEGGQGSAYFRTRVRLLTHRLRGVPEDRRLGPGMVAEAEIKVGTRTVLSYLLYPMFRLLDESLREP